MTLSLLVKEIKRLTKIKHIDMVKRMSTTREVYENVQGFLLENRKIKEPWGLFVVSGIITREKRDLSVLCHLV